MRWSALLLILATACSFDATGFGEPPAATVGPSTTSVGSQGSSSGGGEATAATAVEETVGVSGSGSMTASGTGVDVTGGPTTEVTTEPGSTTSGTGVTTAEPMTTEAMTTEAPCETMMAWVDGDGDGFGDPNMPKMVCVGAWEGVANNPDDCNDTSPAARPGQPEVCDGLDNDCDGKLNEYDATTNKDGCNDCAYRTRNGRLYHFCTWDAKWDEGRTYCQGQGLDLVSVSDDGEHDWLAGQADGLDGFVGKLWWLGGRQQGNPFNWVDGTPIPFPGNWGGGEPNNQGLPFVTPADCVLLLGASWLDYTCGTGTWFICEGPLP